MIHFVFVVPVLVLVVVTVSMLGVGFCKDEPRYLGWGIVLWGVILWLLSAGEDITERFPDLMGDKEAAVTEPEVSE